jgi:hypothetical protein
MTISRNDSAAVEGGPQVISDLLVGGVKTDLGLEFSDPSKDFLVGQSVERTSKTVHGSSERKIRIGEGGANEMAGVGRYVSSLVIAVDGEVETHEFVEGGVVEAKRFGEAGTPVKLGIDVTGGDGSLMGVSAVDVGGNARETGNEIKGILISKIPVELLLHALLVCLGKLALSLKGIDSDGELSHGMGLGM